MKKLLEVKNLCKDGILHRVSFAVEAGEMVAVMGPSGSGKSTLLYNIAGLDQPTAGEVWLDGTEIAGLPEDEKAALRLHRMGFVFQQMNMLSNLNLIDNILLPAVQAQKGKGTKSLCDPPYELNSSPESSQIFDDCPDHPNPALE